MNKLRTVSLIALCLPVCFVFTGCGKAKDKKVNHGLHDMTKAHRNNECPDALGDYQNTGSSSDTLSFSRNINGVLQMNEFLVNGTVQSQDDYSFVAYCQGQRIFGEIKSDSNDENFTLWISRPDELSVQTNTGTGAETRVYKRKP